MTFFTPPPRLSGASAPSDLAERLGFEPGSRVLLINADDYGMCRSANRGIEALLSSGGIGSATLMTPCGWAPGAAEFARTHPDVNVGVHLVFTSEWDRYRWGPVAASASVPSLVDAAGYFHPDIETFEQTADEQEVRAEIFAQIERAIALGVDPTHVDNHMGSLYGVGTGRALLDPVFDACESFDLPFRLPRSPYLYVSPDTAAETAALEAHLAPLVAEADRRGIVILDHLWTLPFDLSPGESYETLFDDVSVLIDSLQPGVTELYFHPFEETDELHEISPGCEKRGWELQLLQDPAFAALLTAADIKTVTWRELRSLQRQERLSEIASA